MEYAFDGLDGLGEPVDRCTAFGARVSFDRVGEIHIIQADVEKRGSLELVRLNGPGAPDATVYWDDTGLDGSKVRGNAPDQLDGTAGVDSTGGVHGWGGGAAWVSNGWGDARWIDDWAYLPTDEIVGTHSFVDTATCGPLPETGSVTVRVVDEDTLDPVPGAVVTLVSTTVPNRTFTATTGADGTVAFEDVPAGDYEIRTGPPVGYLTPPTASITAVAGDDVEATVPLARLTTAGTPDSSLTFDGDPELLDGGIRCSGRSNRSPSRSADASPARPPASP